MTTYSLQPKDSDLDAIAALSTTAFGRSLLAAADAAAARTLIGAAASGEGGNGGAVDSVNGQIGTVVLDADDVGADASGAAAAAQAASQPLDSDLTAIAALSTTSFGRSFLALADAAAARTLIGAETAGAAAAAQAASQPLDSDLTAIAALTTTSTGRSVLAAADAAAIRTIAGAQASSTNLSALGGVTSAADKGVYFTGSGTASTFDLGSFARGLLALTTSSSVRTYLGLVIGTDVQAFNSNLASIAGLTTTTFGRSVLEVADAAALRTLAVLGTAATVNTGTSSGDVPLLSTGGRLPIARVASGTADGTKFVRDDGTLAVPPGAGTGEAVATSALWDAKGDLAVGTGSDTADNLTVGANDTILMADSAANAMGLKWATPSVVRTALGLVIGTNVQAYDADLTALAGVTSAADALPYFTGSGAATTTTLTTFGRSLIDDADASTARTTLGLVIGTDVQAYDSDLANLAGIATTSYGRSFLAVADASAGRTYLGVAIGSDVQAYSSKLTTLAAQTWAADTFTYYTSASAVATATVTSFARTLLDDTTQSAARATLGLTPGTDVQAYDPELAALAGVTSAADTIAYFTGSGTATTTGFTSTARSLLDDSSTRAMRTTLGSDATDTVYSIPANGRKWAAKLNARTVSSPARMVAFGDSVTEGAEVSYLRRFRETAAVFNGFRYSTGWVPGSKGTESNIDRDHIFTVTTGTGTETTDGLARNAISLASGAVATLQRASDSATATVTADRVEVRYTASGTAGAGTLTVKGGSDGTTTLGTIDTYDAALGSGNKESGRVATYTFTRGPLQLNVSASVGAAIFDGAYIADGDTVYVYNGGNSGLAGNDFNNVNGPWQSLENYDADLMVWAHGLVDGVGSSTFYANNITNAVDYARAAVPDISLGVLIPYAIDSRTTWDTTYVAAARAAANNLAVPVIDVSWMLDDPANISDPYDLIGTDATHPKAGGADLIGAALSRFVFGEDLDLSVPRPLVSNMQTGTSFTPLLPDAGKMIELNNASAVSFSIATNAFVPFPLGTTLEIVQMGAGQVTVSGSGVTFRSRNGLKTAGQYAVIRLWKQSTNTWVVSGDTTT